MPLLAQSEGLAKACGGPSGWLVAPPATGVQCANPHSTSPPQPTLNLRRFAGARQAVSLGVSEKKGVVVGSLVVRWFVP